MFSFPLRQVQDCTWLRSGLAFIPARENKKIVFVKEKMNTEALKKEKRAERNVAALDVRHSPIFGILF